MDENSFKTSSCPLCGVEMQAAAGADRVRCPYCGHEYTLVQAGSVSHGPVFQLPLPPGPPPSGCQIEVNPQYVRIVHPLGNSEFLMLALCSLTLDFFMWGWYAVGLRAAGDMAWAFIFSAPLLLVLLGLNYYTLASLVNHTVLLLTRDELTIQPGPLPWIGKKRICSADILQFYCQKTVFSKGRNRRDVSLYAYQYELFAITRDNHSRLLLDNIARAEIASFYEEQLRQLLGIASPAVPIDLSGAEAKGNPGYI
jgi:hypothetical protein